MTDSVINYDFEQFKAKHDEWSKCFSQSDPSSVLQQLWTLEDSSAVNRAVLRIIESAEREHNGTPKLPPLIFAAVRRWHSNNHIMALRKLTEPYNGKKDKRGVKAVYSLRWLLDDMAANSSLISRENLVRNDGLVDEKSIAELASDEFLDKREAQGEKFLRLPKELQPDLKERRQVFIDKICGTSADTRRESDSISIKLIDNFIVLMDCSCRKIKHYADKYLAHSATPTSRKEGFGETVNLAWRDIWEAEKTVCQVAAVVERILFADTVSILVPRIEVEYLKYLDHPLITSDKIHLVEDAWHEYSREVNSWKDWDWEKLV
jgi:hypothetical protein